MSPGESVREKALSLLADPEKGLNAAFLYHCQKRQIPVPFTGDGGNPAEPFDFSETSNNVFRVREDINWLSNNSNQQYPCLIAYAGPSRQDRAGRPLGVLFHGNVQLDLLVYVAWFLEDTDHYSDFEAHLDALEEAAFFVLNSDPSGWGPVRYWNWLDVTERTTLETCNNGQCVRRAIHFSLTAGVTLQGNTTTFF